MRFWKSAFLEMHPELELLLQALDDFHNASPAEAEQLERALTLLP